MVALFDAVAPSKRIRWVAPSFFDYTFGRSFFPRDTCVPSFFPPSSFDIAPSFPLIPSSIRAFRLSSFPVAPSFSIIFSFAFHHFITLSLFPPFSVPIPPSFFPQSLLPSLLHRSFLPISHPCPLPSHQPDPQTNPLLTEITAIYPPPYLSWHPPHTLDTHIRQGLLDIRTYIADNGPYDACLGFSQGAVMLALLLLEDSAANLHLSPSTNGNSHTTSSTNGNGNSNGSSTNGNSPSPPSSHPPPPLFQLAIFLSGSLYPLAHPLLRSGARISIPTTHIWGGKRDYITANGAGEALRDACVAEGRVVVEHGEGHVVPRGGGVSAVVGGVERGVRRAIYKS